MLNLVPSHIPGAGLRSGTRAMGTRWLGLGLLGLILTGCATKGDIRNIQDEVRALAAQQRQTLEELSGLNLAVQDTLGRQSDAIFESRGDTNRRLSLIEQELITIQELLRMNQQSIMALRDLMESGGTRGVSPMATDQNPGQTRDVSYVPGGDQAGGAEDAFNTARTMFQRGQRGTARMAFQGFLRSYPADARVPDAHYFLADILAQEDKLVEARDAFLVIPTRFPTSDRAAEAYYRVGVIYMSQNDMDAAKSYLVRVVETYPDSESAAAAQDRLDEIG